MKHLNLQCRAKPAPADEVEGERREVTGIAVPWNTITELYPGYFEQIERGAIEEYAGGVKLYWRHGEPIGTITTATDTEQGYEITAKISDTTAGRDAWTLVQDGAINRFSIGFRQQDYTDDYDTEADTLTRTHTRIELCEVSLVPFPAYEGAELTQYRAKKEANEMEKTKIEELAANLTETRGEIAELSRRLDCFTPSPTANPATDTRSIGQILKAIVAGDTDTIEQVNKYQAREYNGAVLADSGVKTPAWVGDLTRLVDQANPLATYFASSPLPSTGNTLEYAELATNSLTVTKQEKEGDPLTFGKASLQTKTAQVYTYGGYTTLSRQAIERSPINVLDLHMRAMALAAGKASAEVFANDFATAVKGQAAEAMSLGKKLEAVTWKDLAGLILDAAAKYADNGLQINALIVLPAVFKQMVAMTEPDRLMFNIAGSANPNQIGQLDLGAINGSLAGMKVIPDLKAKANTYGDNVIGCFANFESMRVFKTPVVNLQDENIINLTKDFSCYFYQANACQVPAGLVPVKVTA